MNAHICYTNMTLEEEFRINGTLSVSTIETVLDKMASQEEVNASGAVVYIDEASGCFPTEDFMEDELRELRTIANRLRGANKLQMLDLLERLTQERNQINQSAEYGADELKKAKKCLIK
jgi:hypothetical protein